MILSFCTRVSVCCEHELFFRLKQYEARVSEIGRRAFQEQEEQDMWVLAAVAVHLERDFAGHGDLFERATFSKSLEYVPLFVEESALIWDGYVPSRLCVSSRGEDAFVVEIDDVRADKSSQSLEAIERLIKVMDRDGREGGGLQIG